MDRLSQYLEIVPLPVLVGGSVAAFIMIMMIPTRWRLDVLLAVLPLWLTLGQFQRLGAISAVAKASGAPLLAMVALSAFLTPGPKRRIGVLPHLFVVHAIVAFPFMLTVIDRNAALVIRLQWLVLVLAAIGTVRTICTEEDLLKRLKALGIGLGLTLIAASADLIMNPSLIFASGLGRMQIWGANQNQVGTALVAAMPILVYFGLRPSLAIWWRLAALGLAGMGGLIASGTASRSVVFPIALLLAAIGWRVLKRPIALVGAGLTIIVVLAVSGSAVQDVDTDRLKTLESERFSQWAAYFEDIRTSGRIVTGLLGKRDVGSEVAPNIDAHPHNAYILLLYQYGLPIALLMLCLLGAAFFATVKTWRLRRYIAHDGELITLCAAIVCVVYFHGMTTITILHPTYAWAFLHVMMVTLFMSIAYTGQTLFPEHWSPYGYGSYEALDDGSYEDDQYEETGHDDPQYADEDPERQAE